MNGTSGNNGQMNVHRQDAGATPGWDYVRGALWGAALVVLCVVAWSVLAGCEVATESDQGQVTEQAMPSEQTTETPTSTEQDSAAQGNYVRLDWRQSGGEDYGSFHKQETPGVEEPDLLDSAETTGTSGNNSKLAKTKMGYVQFNNLTINIDGTTTPGLTASATGSGSATQTPTGTQTPSANQTITPTQEVKPVAAVPITVALPGGAASGQGTATGEGTTSDVSMTAEQRAQQTQIKAMADQLGEALKLVEQLQQQAPTTPTPTTQPAGQ